MGTFFFSFEATVFIDQSFSSCLRRITIDEQRTTSRLPLVRPRKTHLAREHETTQLRLYPPTTTSSCRRIGGLYHNEGLLQHRHLRLLLGRGLDRQLAQVRPVEQQV